MSIAISQFIPLFASPLGGRKFVFSLHLYLYFCFAKKFIWTIK